MGQLFGRDNESDDEILNVGSSDDNDDLPNPVILRRRIPINGFPTSGSQSGTCPS